MSIDVSVEFPELEEIKAAFRSLSPNLSARYMASALNKAIEPGVRLLKELTPRGPTGNLRRSIAKKTKKYSAGPNSRNPARSPGAAVALAGFRATRRLPAGAKPSANEKGYHAGFLEFGTKQRFTKKGSIASSFSRSGPVRISRAARSGNVTTTPKPPKGFVKRAKGGQPVDLKAFPVGGKGGVPPVRTAFERALPQMKTLLPKEMAIALNNALRDKFGPFGKRKAKA